MLIIVFRHEKVHPKSELITQSSRTYCLAKRHCMPKSSQARKLKAANRRI